MGRPQAEGVEERVLGKIVGLKKEDITGSSKKCKIRSCIISNHHKIIMRVIKQRRGWVGSVVCSKDKRHACWLSVGKPEEATWKT